MSPQNSERGGPSPATRGWADEAVRPSGLRGGSCPSQRQVRESADRSESENRRGNDWSRRQSDQAVDRQSSEPRQSERDRSGTVEQRHFDAVVLRKQSMRPMHAAGGDDHHREHDRGADWAEEAGGDEEAADDLAERSGGGEEAAGAEADRLQEAGGAVEAVAAEPSEEFLAAVGGHDESKNETGEEKSFIHTFDSFRVSTILNIATRNSQG